VHIEHVTQPVDCGSLRWPRRLGNQIPYSVALALVTLATAWPAAGYGALVIWVAGDFASTSSYWVFGWPFAAMLTAATALHLLLLGLGPPMFALPVLRRLQTFKASGLYAGQLEQLDAPAVGSILHAVVRLPTINACVGGVLAAGVTLGSMLTEYVVAGVDINVGVIARGGMLVTMLYVFASFSLGELMTREACRLLRRRAVELGLAPYDGFIVPAFWLVTASFVPTIVSVLVAIEVGLSSRGPNAYAHVAVISLTAAIALGLNWLQYTNNRRAAQELGTAFRDLASGRDAQLITGGADPLMLEIGQTFDAAARKVGADRRASSERYQALFEGAADAIVLADPLSGRIVAANAHAAALFGRPPLALMHGRYLSLYSEPTRIRHVPFFRAAGADGFLADGEVLRSNGGTCPVDIAITVLPLGSEWCLQAIIRDVSERHAMRAALERQLSAVRAAQVQLIENDRMKTEFVGMMSHELRTPLNIFLGYTQMLLDATRSDAARVEDVEILHRMIFAGRTLSELIEDTLSVLRMEAGAVHLDLEEVWLPAMFDELRSGRQVLQPRAEVEEVWEVAADVPTLNTDRRKLRQIITNLVSNARKFTDAGQIVIHAGVASAGSIRITVSDSGCGISADHVPFIFDLYRQAPSGRAHDGCGLGLYIVRRYVEMLQGSVVCASVPRGGTTMTIELPCNLESRATVRSAA
jgi:PAS domain S-box-containing protein